MRIESAMIVTRVKVGSIDFLCMELRLNTLLQTKNQFNGDIWLGFERLTCVPIQTKMVKDLMLTKEERQWLKVSCE